MIIQLGLLCFVGSLSLTTALPSCVCPRILRPICGSDGRTYNNDCLLRCAQSADPGLVMARTGRCDGNSFGPPRDVRQADFGCICTLEYMPVCGTDGKTYPNKCSLNCPKQSGPIEIAHMGPCRNKREAVLVAQLPSRCSCPRNFAPVCGNDGKTYDNHCVFDCMSEKNPELRLLHDGMCEADPEPCVCTREVLPICGSDGITYQNPCMFRCARDNNKDLVMQHIGDCGDSGNVVQPSPCTCTRESRPVCGSDGNTYGNPCMLNCAREQNENLHLDYEGSCRDVEVMTTRCEGCTRRRRPVCGTDGNTYWNPCVLNCARENDQNLHIRYEGPCATAVNFVEEAENVSCTCPRILRPVCASNGVSFDNRCLMRCAGTHLTVDHEGACEELSL